MGYLTGMLMHSEESEISEILHLLLSLIHLISFMFLFIAC